MQAGWDHLNKFGADVIKRCLPIIEDFLDTVEAVEFFGSFFEGIEQFIQRLSTNIVIINIFDRKSSNIGLILPESTNHN